MTKGKMLINLLNKFLIMEKKLFLFFITGVFLLSCSPQNEAEKVGSKFVELYYQQMNQQEAMKISEQSAKEKLLKEYNRVMESRVMNPQFRERNPKISYKLKDAKFDNDMGFLTFWLYIKPEDFKPFERAALITVKKIDGSWKVINFDELNSKPVSKPLAK